MLYRVRFDTSGRNCQVSYTVLTLSQAYQWFYLRLFRPQRIDGGGFCPFTVWDRENIDVFPDGWEDLFLLEEDVTRGVYSSVRHEPTYVDSSSEYYQGHLMQLACLCVSLLLAYVLLVVQTGSGFRDQFPSVRRCCSFDSDSLRLTQSKTVIFHNSGSFFIHFTSVSAR